MIEIRYYLSKWFATKLHGNHDVANTVFLVDGYLTALSRLELNGQLDYVDRKTIGNWFHTLKMRFDHFHNS